MAALGSMFSTRIWNNHKKGLKPLREGVEGQKWGDESMAKLLLVVWMLQNSSPGIAFFRHRCPAVVRAWHGDLQRRHPSAPQEATSTLVSP